MRTNRAPFRAALTVSLGIALPSALLAQDGPPADAAFLNVDPAIAFEARSEPWQQFLQRVPGEWRTRWCAATGTPQAVYGPGLTVSEWRENSLEEGRRHALLLLQQESELLGLGTSEFRETIGSRMGRTWCFVFDQYFHGLPVIEGRADVRVHMVGKVSMFGSSAFPIPADFGTVPALAELAATQIAWQALGQLPPAADQPAGPRQPRLVIWGDIASAALAPVHLAWEIPVSAVDASGSGPVGRYYVDANNGDVLHYRNDKHECGFGCSLHGGRDGGESDAPSEPVAAPAANSPLPPATGVVMAYTRVGVSGVAPLVNVPLQNLEINVPGVGIVTTDSTGTFTANIAANTNVTVILEGLHTLQVQGANQTTVFNTLIPGQTTNFQFLWSGATADLAAHTSTYYWADRVNIWTRSILGNTTQLNTMDVIRPTVNITSTCNAYYTNNSINFYAAGGGCNNTGYSSVVAHEWGHGLDDQYGGISQTNGLSEGWGDIVGMYLLDSPIIGLDFQTLGGYLRSGNNTVQYPNGNGVHQQGQSWGGFAWKLRDRLAITLPSRAAAITLTNDIVLGTIVADAGDQQSAVLEVLLADDNDANLNNGTPHSPDIVFACNQHSLPNPYTNTPTTNDACTSAITVTNGLNGPFTSVGAQTSTPAWSCGMGGADVWFRYDCTNFGTLQVDTCNQAAFDTVIEIFSGDCSTLTSVGCNDDSCSVRSSLSISASPGTYYIRVGGKSGANGPFNLDVNGPTGNPASATQYGAGCYPESKAFYELFANPSSFDLNNTGMQLVNAGLNYFALPGATGFVAPSASAMTLTLADDAEATINLSSAFPYPGGATTSLAVCSNGFVSVATGNGTSSQPTATDWLAAVQPRWGTWHDLDPSAAGSGSVKFEEVGGFAYITWDGVYSAGTTSPNTWQLQLDLSTGNIAYVWQTMSGVGNAMLVGYAHIAPNTDVGSIDISARLPATFQTSPQNQLGLTMSSTPPQLGSAATMTTINYPPGSGLGFQVMSFTRHDPGLPLAAFGMPGCAQYVNSDVTVILVPVGGQSTFNGPIPNDTSLMGVTFYGQSFALSSGANALGLISSNGVRFVIGT